MAALSTLLPGSFFKLAGVTSAKPDQFLLSKDTGTVGTALVVANLTKSQITEFDATTEVIELSLTTSVTPSFSLA